MEKIKKKIKRLLVGLVATASMLIVTVSPALAADVKETESEVTDKVAQDTIEAEDLIDYKFFDESVTSKYGLDPTLIVDDNIDSVILRAGNETWTGSGFGGAYTFNNYNLTPVKTMGKSGRLLISGYFYGTDGYASSSPIALTVEIRSTSGAVLGHTYVNDNRSGNVPFAVSASVSAGQQIQLFFDASSIANPPGIYRSAYVNYDYDLY